MFLNDEHILVLRNHIDRSVSMKNLKEDLLDHLCCAVESKVKDGKDFAMAVDEAMRELAPNGFHEIENETNYLLNQNNIRMKKFLYSFGLAATISMAMGLMMKLLHMPGGEQLVNYGVLSFTVIFLPGITIMNSKNMKDCSRVEKFKVLFGILSATLLAISVCLKMTLNLDAAEILFMTVASVFSFGFLPCLFYGLYKKSQLASA